MGAITAAAPKASLRTMLYIMLVLLALATAAIVWQETIIDQQRLVIRGLSGFHFSDGRT
jgi:hypothetical protein